MSGNVEALWREHGWLVDHWATKWAARAGRDPTDCWDACLDAFLRSAETWDPEKGAAFNTWLTKGLWLRLRHWSQQEIRTARALPTVSLEVVGESLPDRRSDRLRSSAAELGPGARRIVNLILDVPGAFKTVGQPLKELTALAVGDWGWTEREMEQVVEEIREMLRSL